MFGRATIRLGIGPNSSIYIGFILNCRTKFSAFSRNFPCLYRKLFSDRNACNRHVYANRPILTPPHTPTPFHFDLYTAVNV